MRKQNLSANITIGGVVSKSFKNGIGVIRSGFENVGDSIKDVKRRQKELTRDRADLIKQGKSVEALDREFEDLERTLVSLEMKQRRWERAMRDSARVGDKFGKMTDRLGRSGRRIGAVTAGAAAGIFAIASSTAEYGDNVAKTAQKVGIGIEALQEFRYAAERSGISTATFDSSLTAMQKRLGEAAAGTGAAKKALDEINLSANDLIAMGPEAALAAIADAIQDVESPAKRAALAAALFSRSGIGMVNMLGSGSEGLKQLQVDARRTGYVLSKEAARDAETFADAQLDAQLTVKGLKNTIGAELMPVVTRSMQRFSMWARSNREDVARFADTAATKLEAALPVVGQIAEGMGRVSTTIGTGISKLSEMVGGWENLGIVVGAALAAKTIGSVVSFGLAVGRLGISLANLVGVAPLVAKGISFIGKALLATPIGLIVGAIAGAAVLIYKHWDHVGPWFAEMWGGVKDTFGGFGQFLSGTWRGDMALAASGLARTWDGARSLLSTTWQGITGVFRFAWQRGIKPITDRLGVTTHITSAWAAVTPMFQSYFDGLGKTFSGVSRFVGGVWRGDMDAAAAGLPTAWGASKGAIGDALAGISSVFTSLWTGSVKPITDRLGVTTHITSAWAAVTPMFQRYFDGLGKTFSGVSRFVGGVWRGDMDAAAAGLSTAWGASKGAIGDALAGVSSVFTSLWTGSIKPTFDKMGATAPILKSWVDLKDGVSKSIGNVGQVLGTIYKSAIEPVIAALSSTGGVTEAWDAVQSAVGSVVNYLAERFDWLMEKLRPVLESLKWLRDKGAGAIEGVQGIGSGVRQWFGGSEDTETSVVDQTTENPRAGRARPRRISGSFIGGDIGPGFRRVGEQGEETIWTSKGRYVAHARATEKLAMLSQKAEPLFAGLGAGMKRAMATARDVAAPVSESIQRTATSVTAPQSQRSPDPATALAPVVIHAQINAQGLSVHEVADELERRGRAASAGQLFDGAHGFGQYG